MMPPPYPSLRCPSTYRSAFVAQTDYTSMALSAGPLDVPLGPLQALSTFLPNDASPLAAETESILKNLRTIQEQACGPLLTKRPVQVDIEHTTPQPVHEPLLDVTQILRSDGVGGFSSLKCRCPS